MGEHITVEDSFDYVKKATEPLQQRIEELEKGIKTALDEKDATKVLKYRIVELKAELEAQKKDKAGIAVSNSKLMFENKRLEKLLSDIYYTFESEPYFTSTGRLQIAMWIKDIKRRINMLKEGE